MMWVEHWIIVFYCKDDVNDDDDGCGGVVADFYFFIF